MFVTFNFEEFSSCKPFDNPSYENPAISHGHRLKQATPVKFHSHIPSQRSQATPSCHKMKANAPATQPGARSRTNITPSLQHSTIQTQMKPNQIPNQASGATSHMMTKQIPRLCQVEETLRRSDKTFEELWVYATRFSFFFFKKKKWEKKKKEGKNQVTHVGKVCHVQRESTVLTHACLGSHTGTPSPPPFHFIPFLHFLSFFLTDNKIK